ncbi:PepSY domain-containing protein [uncultured Christiangramia sp.]|uniref:PepSY-associated TM helix domain-containing protein n=1 Tax=uncultured Christiangramia sp. TaxID=503836 RepID=UPI0025E07132|nr:PepSY-associated TM helix domain-containing protein [uncultured Christiangramia sp.]
MKKKKAYTFRNFMTDVHLWLGLASGIILFLVCFSGTMLVFEKEIESIFAEELHVVPSSEKLSIDELTSRMSEKGTVSSVSIPTEASEAYEFRVKTSPEDRRGTTFMMDPYSAEILKPEPSPLDGFFSVMFRMHRWLLLDTSIGRPIVGVATIIFLFLSISGIIIWFPKKWKWKAFKPGFKIKWSANWKRINHDLHNTLGFYSCIFLVIMILTGLCWSFEWYREAGSQVLGTKIFGGRGGPGITSETPGSKVISLSEAYTISNFELKYAGKTSISIPQEETNVLEIRKYGDNNWSPSTSDLLVLDRNGTVLKKELFDDKDLNVKIASLIKPLHTGEIFGIFSKIIYFLACLIATSLPVTGTIIWLNKMKKKKRKL